MFKLRGEVSAVTKRKPLKAFLDIIITNLHSIRGTKFFSHGQTNNSINTWIKAKPSLDKACSLA